MILTGAYPRRHTRLKADMLRMEKVLPSGTASHKKRKNFGGQHGNTACDFYNRYPQDIQLMSRLHIPNYRFSLAWSRIFPNGTGSINQKGVDYYNRLIDTCLANGIQPWVTLYHWDLPQSLEQKGGWTNREILNWFGSYTEFCVKQFGDRVNRWMILNEPMVFTGAGYFLGVHAPGKKGLTNFLSAVHHAALCQAEGGRIVKSLQCILPGRNNLFIFTYRAI